MECTSLIETASLQLLLLDTSKYTKATVKWNHDLIDLTKMRPITLNLAFLTKHFAGISAAIKLFIFRHSAKDELN